ncbi:MAG TPA: hypothetical protein VLF63_02190 [Patescibacteria group bacterium]|nr:hypothetical protein [Patescibacteria group bacterium]
MTNLKQFFYKQTKKNQFISASLAILVIAIIGTLILTHSHAAGPFVSLNSDQGNLTGPTSIKTSGSISDGKYVQFGSTGVGKDEGKPLYRVDAASSFDQYSDNSTWIKANINRILAYPTFGNKYIAYGIPVLSYHDPNGPGTPIDLSTTTGFNQYMSLVNTDISNGYAGTFVDDVNFTACGACFNTPANLAKAIAQIRVNHPGIIIEINTQWHDLANIYNNPSNQYYSTLQNMFSNVNQVDKEFGMGPTAGITSVSDYEAFLTYVDYLHNRGIHIDLTADHNSTTSATMEYNTATYFLFNDGGDYTNGENTVQNPTTQWPGFSVNLGNATSTKSKSSSGLFTRTFQHGVSYVVEPGGQTQTITPPTGAKDINGNAVSSFSLSQSQGKIIVLP